jgi:hypothetical protein
VGMFGEGRLDLGIEGFESIIEGEDGGGQLGEDSGGELLAGQRDSSTSRPSTTPSAATAPWTTEAPRLRKTSHDHQHGRVNTQHQPSGEPGTGQKSASDDRRLDTETRLITT